MKCSKEDPNKSADRHPMQLKEVEFTWSQGLAVTYECQNTCGLMIVSRDREYMERYA